MVFMDYRQLSQSTDLSESATNITIFLHIEKQFYQFFFKTKHAYSIKYTAGIIRPHKTATTIKR